MEGRKLLFVALSAALMIVATAVVAIAFSKTSGNQVIDAPNNAGMKAAEGGDVRWILPGLRELDPAIFGTPDAPLRTELLPFAKRAVTGDDKYVAGMGGAPMPTPFSNNWMPISGETKVKVKDVTAVSGPTTKDEIDAEFEFTSPDGQISYRPVVKQAIPALRK